MLDKIWNISNNLIYPKSPSYRVIFVYNKFFKNSYFLKDCDIKLHLIENINYFKYRHSFIENSAGRFVF